MDWLVTLVTLTTFAVLIGFVVRRFVEAVVIHDYERGLRYRRGKLSGLLGAGTYVGLRLFNEVRVLDVRPVFVTVENQELLTADGIAAKLSLVARYVVADPAAAITRDADYQRSTYLLLQLGLRDAIARRTLDEVLAARRELGPEIREACAGQLAGIGVELLSVDTRDVMLSGELKRAFGRVVATRKEGEAALEAARAEIASLRALGNAGRMLDDNPGLLQLRILQELGESSGNTIVFGAPDAGTSAPSPAPRTGRSRSRSATLFDGDQR